MASDMTDVSSLVEKFEESEQVTYTARLEAERARDYVDGKQLTEQEIAELKKRGQPPIIINRTRRKIQWLRGVEVKQRTDPRAFPRTPGDEQSAEAATDALRFVADNTRFDRKRSQVWENMLVEGFGGLEIVHRVKGQSRGQLMGSTPMTPPDVEVVVNCYQWDRLFYDPYSRRHDFSDARYLGSVVWQDQAELLEEHPEKRDVVEELQREEQAAETYDDRPRHGLWYDSKRKRVRVVLMWYKQRGAWRYCKFIGKDKLAEGDSPYVDEDGESVCPLIMQSLYVGRDNDRYGIIRDMFGPQDEVNKRRSKGLHLSTMRQVRVSPASPMSRAELSRQLARPDGVIEAEKDEFEILPNQDQAVAQFNMMQEAKNEIDLMGANSALEGETGESTSGRAVLARQQGGMIEIAPEMDELRHFTQRCFEAMWQRVKQFWTGEKWVRVTDDERNIRFAPMNRPVTFGEKLGQMPPEQVQAIAMQIGLRPNDPRLQMPVEVENDITKMSVDIIIEESPDRITLAGETFEALLKYGDILPPEVLIEADPTMPASKKEKLLEKMQQREPSPQEQMQMMSGQAELENKQADTQDKTSSAMKKQADAVKTMQEARTLPLSAAAGL